MMVLSIILAFITGYVLIAIEHKININKAATALLAGVVCWVIYILGSNDKVHVVEQLAENLGEIAGILFFLMGAMTVVELIDAHNGFDVVTRIIKTNSDRKLLWALSLLAFFLSAVLDNLTATIVLTSLARKLISSGEKRLLTIGMIVIAANSGGAWSPIGDVTTTMLWIGGQITASNIMLRLFIPSLVCLLVPTAILSMRFKERIEVVPSSSEDLSPELKRNRNIIFFSGMSILLFVPVFKMVTHLPPFMGMLFGLGLLWFISEILNKDKDEVEKEAFSVVNALRKIDTPSILFFLGILLSVSALQVVGILTNLAGLLDTTIVDVNLKVLTIGLLSALIDNVPLVAAAIGMYDLNTYPTDHYFWEFLAYCSGTGGSALIIGSAAGVAAMGIEKISFTWYLRKISWLALLGYISGALVYIVQNSIT